MDICGFVEQIRVIIPRISRFCVGKKGKYQKLFYSIVLFQLNFEKILFRAFYYK